MRQRRTYQAIREYHEEVGFPMSTAFGAVRQVLKAVSLKSAQSATRYSGSSF